MVKLGEADVSILRLGDVAAELGPRVEELRRQAEAARLQRDVTSQLDALRGSLLQGEWRQARQAVKKATARVETLRAAATTAEAEALAFAVDYEAHKEKLAGAHDARLQRERRMGALRLAATHAGSKVELLAERLASARLGVSQAEAALADARLRLQGLEAEVVAAREDAAAATEPGDTASAGAPGEPPGDHNVDVAAGREHAARAAAEALREAHLEAAAQVHRLEERVSLLRRLAADGDLPAPSARRLVELLAIPAVREAAVAAGIDPATIERWAEEGRLEQAALAAAAAAATAELEGARAGAEAAEAQSRVAVEVEAAAARDLEAARSAHLEELAERRALMGRATALRGRLERCIILVERQREEVGRHEARLAAARGGVAALETETATAEAEAAAARTELETSPIEAEAVEVESLTRVLVEMEKGHLDRQVVLAHQQGALSNASSQLDAESAILADLSERMGGSGEALDDVEVDWEKTQRDINRLERQLAQLGPVNELAIDEFERDGARLASISGQLDDLTRARAGLERIAAELGAEIDRRFEAVFGAVAFNFQDTFAALFVGGRATLKLDDPESADPGVEILAQPAGKRMRNIKLLSGGERALTALAFILALEKVTPSPFYIFDEVDAPLDDANIKRFTALLESMAAENQFILVTHNHATMTVAQALYGVTLEDSGVSRVVSVRLRAGEVVAISGTG
jgi:chromosome segregation protein